MKKRILIVEDNLTLSHIQRSWLEQAGYEVVTTIDEPSARKQIKKTGFDLILSDVRLPEGNGIRLLEWLCKNNMATPFVVMTEYASYADAVNAIKLGAEDYLPKPVHRERLLDLAHSLLNTPSVIRGEKRIFKRVSPQARETERLVRLVAPFDMSVLIFGPSGSGKESIAQSIHQQSDRNGKPFVAVNCGGIPDGLIASEFFGHVKGAFTGADMERKGCFDAAQGGTLFLDEVGNMPLNLQKLLLRVLQERVYQPLGSQKLIKTDVRIIAATNEDMQKLIKEGRFREDLYHRLNEFDLYQPPLCECKEDILPLASFFREQYAGDLRRECEGFTPEAEQMMLDYAWSGNVREMSNRIKRAVLVCSQKLITVTDLGLDTGKPLETTATLRKNTKETLQASKLRKEEEKRRMLVQTLEKTGYNITRTAELLGVSRPSVYALMQKYGLK